MKYLLSTRANKLYLRNVIVIFNIIDCHFRENNNVLSYICEKNIKFIIINILLSIIHNRIILINKKNYIYINDNDI